jgi:ABC-type phosphate transport system permease subunit
MKTISGFAQQTVGRYVLAGALAVGVLVSPIVWSVSNGAQQALPETVVASHNNHGIDQLQWLEEIQPHAQAPHVDTTVHQSQ